MPGIDECLGEAMRLPGARSAAVIDWISGLALGVAGDAPGGDHEASACEAAEVARMVAEHGTFAPPEDERARPGARALPAVEDVIVTSADSYHLLRFVGAVYDSSVFLHLCVGREEGNLAMARLRLEDIATRMVL
ncbi:hypothetical protein GCM10009801_20130 [Streptomyces albiaxialis]|uniref:Roadblock/LAMTOR2 domain-containing protein n=1 Tax=Streptomyces albiaxialis TaxID=329523 RepID=A0ABP5HAY3_9ACTN